MLVTTLETATFATLMDDAGEVGEYLIGTTVDNTTVAIELHEIEEVGSFPLDAINYKDGKLWAPEVYTSTSGLKFLSTSDNIDVYDIPLGSDFVNINKMVGNIVVSVYDGSAPYIKLYSADITESFYDRDGDCLMVKCGRYTIPYFMVKSGNVLVEHIEAFELAVKKKKEANNQIKEIEILYTVNGGIAGYTQEDDALYIRDTLKAKDEKEVISNKSLEENFEEAFEALKTINKSDIRDIPTADNTKVSDIKTDNTVTVENGEIKKDSGPVLEEYEYEDDNAAIHIKAEVKHESKDIYKKSYRLGGAHTNFLYNRFGKAE